MTIFITRGEIRQWRPSPRPDHGGRRSCVFYTGWYNGLVSGLPVVRNGEVSISDAPGLGLPLLPEVVRRTDAVLRVSEAS